MSTNASFKENAVTLAEDTRVGPGGLPAAARAGDAWTATEDGWGEMALPVIAGTRVTVSVKDVGSLR